MNTRGRWADIDEIRSANRVRGYFWFTPGALRYFKSRILEGVYGGRYFVTSERGPHGPRAYSVRAASDDATIDTVGDFMGYRRADQARAAAKELAAELEANPMTPPDTPTPAALRAAVKILRHVQGNADNVPDDDIRALRSTATLARIIDAETRVYQDLADEQSKQLQRSPSAAQWATKAGEIGHLRAEVDRLRAALESVKRAADAIRGCAGFECDDNAAWLGPRLSHIQDTARAALDETRTK